MKSLFAKIIPLLTLVPFLVHGQEGATSTFIVCSGPDCNFGHVIQLLKNIVDFLIVFSTVVVSITFSWAGFLYLSSQGSSGQMEKAKGIFWTATKGFAIVLSAWLIVNTLMRALVYDEFIFQ